MIIEFGQLRWASCKHRDQKIREKRKERAGREKRETNVKNGSLSDVFWTLTRPKIKKVHKFWMLREQQFPSTNDTSVIMKISFVHCNNETALA